MEGHWQTCVLGEHHQLITTPSRLNEFEGQVQDETKSLPMTLEKTHNKAVQSKGGPVPPAKLSEERQAAGRRV